MDANTRYALEKLPVDEFTVAQQSFLELEELEPEEQASQFAERFVFLLGAGGLKDVYKIQKDFELACMKQWGNESSSSGPSRHTRNQRVSSFSSVRSSISMLSYHSEKNFLPLTCTQFTWFLERRAKTMAQLHRKNAFHGLLNSEGGITLLGYLLYHYRRKILIRYFHRRNKKAPKKVLGLQCSKDLGDSVVGFQLDLHGARKKVAAALKEEMFLRVPFGVDPVLDAGLLQFDEFMTPLRMSILELQEIIKMKETSVVKRNRARGELNSMTKQYVDAYHVSYSKILVYIEKLRKMQQETFLKLKSELLYRASHRQMTLAKN